MKANYFDQSKADEDDDKLRILKELGYISPECLLGGDKAAEEITLKGKSPCLTCDGPRDRCRGRAKE